MRPKLEKDTAKVLESQKMWKEFVVSGGWVEAKKRFMDKIAQHASLLRVTFPPNTSNEAMAREYTARSLIGTLAVQLINDIEGDAAQYEYNLSLLNKSEENEIYKFFPEKVENQ